MNLLNFSTMAAGIEYRQTLRQSDILYRAIVTLTVNGGIFYVYLFTYSLSATSSDQFLRRAIAFQLMWQNLRSYLLMLFTFPERLGVE